MIPLTLLFIFVLLYFSSRSLVKVLIVFLAAPFSLVGAFLLEMVGQGAVGRHPAAPLLPGLRKTGTAERGRRREPSYRRNLGGG